VIDVAALSELERAVIAGALQVYVAELCGLDVAELAGVRPRAVDLAMVTAMELLEELGPDA